MKSKQQGFTIIELVTVIILLGILAITVVPKFFGSNGFEVYAYRTQMIAVLRLAQQRAMHQTDTTGNTINTSLCHEVTIDASGKQIGTPNRNNCTNQFPDGWNPADGDGRTNDGILISSNHDVTITIENQANPRSIGFDEMGRPTGDCITSTIPGCTINIVGDEDTLTIKIEREGYIHAL